MHCEHNKLLLEIANDSSDSDKLTTEFTPRSISARARTLGGTCFVKFDTLGYTVVHVNIPL